MLGVGTTLRNGVLAALLAIFAHLLILSIRLTNQDISITQKSTLKVVLQPKMVPHPVRTQPEDEPTSSDPLPESSVEDLIVAESELGQPPTRLQLSKPLNRQALRRFIEQESAAHGQRNSDDVKRFSDTFEERSDTRNEIENDSVSGRAESQGRGVFATQDKHGNRTCYAEIYDLLSPGGESSLVSKDCTPKERLELKL